MKYLCTKRDNNENKHKNAMQSGKGTVLSICPLLIFLFCIFVTLGTGANKDESHFPQMEKTWINGEPYQEWQAYKKYSKSMMRARMTHSGGYKRTQNNT